MSNGSRRLLLRGAAAPSPGHCRLLQAPAVKVKHRPRRGGGRHACPLCLKTWARTTLVLCTSPCAAFRCPTQVDSTTRGTNLPTGWQGWLAIMHLELSRPPPDLSRQPDRPAAQPSRMPQLQSPPGSPTPSDTGLLFPSPSVAHRWPIGGPSVVETTACRGGAKVSSRIWTNDTRRDEDKKKSPRAEATAARKQAPSNRGQTRACFTAVQTEDRLAWPPESPSAAPIHIPAITRA